MKSSLILGIGLLCLPLAAPAQITVTDQRGVTHTFAKPVERVVTAVLPASALFIAVDGSDKKLVGLNANAAPAVKNSILAEIYPNAVKIPAVVGNNFAPNVEEIVRLKPDVVIQWGTADTDIRIAPLEAVGIKVIGLKLTDPPNDLWRWIEIFGAITGKNARADSIITWHKKALAQVNARTAQLSADGIKKPRIIHLGAITKSLSASNNIWTYRIAGGDNPAEGQVATQVNAEQILVWDPEIITINNFDDGTPQMVYDHPVLRMTKAAKNKRVYKVPLGGYRWEPPNQEWPLLWMWISQVMYPQKQSFDVRKEIQEAYQLLYNYKLSEDQIDKILWVKDLNSGATDYKQFHRKP